MNELDLDPADQEEQQALAYAGAVLEYLERRQSESDPLEVTPSMLQEAVVRVTDWANSLERVHADEEYMQNTVGYSDNVMTAMAAWPPMKPSRYMSGISGAVESFVGKTTAALTHISDEATQVRSELANLESAENALAVKIEAEKQRISEAIATFKTESADAVQAQLADLSSRIDGQNAAWLEADDAYRQRAQDLLEQLERHEVSARKTVHATVAWTVATDYGKYARGQSVAAWVCDIGAAIVGAGGLGAILYHLFTLDPDADANVGLSFTRFAVSVAAIGIAAFLGRRGAQHHREARVAKRTDLALRKLGPFIADLPEDEQQLIVQEFTDRVFIRGDLESADESKRPPLREQLAQLRKDRAKTAVGDV